MSIVEIIEADTGRLKRIDYWNDGKVRVVQSHTMSLDYFYKHSENMRKNHISCVYEKQPQSEVYEK